MKKDEMIENNLIDDHSKYGTRDYTTEQSNVLLNYYKNIAK